MIRITEFDNICQRMKNATAVDHYITASTEEQGKKKIKDFSGLILVAVYPDYSFSGDNDTPIVEHDLLFFIVVREKEAQSSADELNQYQATQDAVFLLKEFILSENEDQCVLFPNANIQSLSIEPEYNIFGGYLGWSFKISV